MKRFPFHASLPLSACTLGYHQKFFFEDVCDLTSQIPYPPAGSELNQRSTSISQRDMVVLDGSSIPPLNLCHLR